MASAPPRDRAPIQDEIITALKKQIELLTTLNEEKSALIEDLKHAREVYVQASKQSLDDFIESSRLREERLCVIVEEQIEDIKKLHASLEEADKIIEADRELFHKVEQTLQDLGVQHEIDFGSSRKKPIDMPS